MNITTGAVLDGTLPEIKEWTMDGRKVHMRRFLSGQCAYLDHRKKGEKLPLGCKPLKGGASYFSPEEVAAYRQLVGKDARVFEGTIAC